MRMRTPHLPWSPGAAADDVRVGDVAGLRGREVVVTEKLNGENTTLRQWGGCCAQSGTWASNSSGADNRQASKTSSASSSRSMPVR